MATGNTTKITKDKNPYSDNFTEILRRQDARQNRRQNELESLLSDNNSSTAINITSNTQETVNPSAVPSQDDYQFVMLNKSHIGMNPRSKEPAVRILGLFKSRQEAIRHVETLKQCNVLDDLGDIHLAPRMKWVLLPKNKERDRDPNYTNNKIEQLRTVHVSERERANNEFKAKLNADRAKSEDNASQIAQVPQSSGPQISKTTLSLAKQREKGLANQKNKTTRQQAIKTQNRNAKLMVEKNPTLEVAKIPRNAELRGQNYVVMAIWRDFTQDVMKLKDEPEPAVLFIDCFDQLEEAKKCEKQTLARYIHILDMDIVTLYEWIYPEQADPDKLPEDKEMWRDDEQSLILNQRKAQTELRKDYEAEHRRVFNEPPKEHNVEAIGLVRDDSDVKTEKDMDRGMHINTVTGQEAKKLYELGGPSSVGTEHNTNKVGTSLLPDIAGPSAAGNGSACVSSSSNSE